MTRKQRRIYRNAARLLQNSTPLRADCGALCDRACCRGDEETGMLLFPGETTPFHVVAQNGRRVAVCGGQCDRSDRPLSCRLFPFLPVPTDDGTISVRLDMRGQGVCPLVRLEKEAAFSHRFLHRVRRAGQQLLRDSETRAFLWSLRREAETCEEMRRLLFKK